MFDVLAVDMSVFIFPSTKSVSARKFLMYLYRGPEWHGYPVFGTMGTETAGALWVSGCGG